MSYWKGKTGTPKQGQVGTMPDNGQVPDSEPATLDEYNAFIATQPPIIKPDYVALYAAATTDSQRIDILAQKAGVK